MQRSFSFPALVLRVKPLGEHREAFFLSAEDGVISATLFGGPKSRLRSHVSPFNSGLLWTYRDTSKEFRKVSDFDVLDWRPGLRELYERCSAASFVAQVILAGHGGGGAFTEAFALANAVMDALSSADEACCERILLYFLWNWSGLLGNRGNDLRRCSFCACESDDDEVLWFIPGEGFLCKNCMLKERRDVRENPAGKKAAALSPNTRRWLLTVQDRPPSELVHFPADTVSLGELKALVNMLES